MRGNYHIMTTAEVHVAIYDISMGMAKNMSGKSEVEIIMEVEIIFDQ